MFILPNIDLFVSLFSISTLYIYVDLNPQILILDDIPSDIDGVTTIGLFYPAKIAIKLP
jgi:hypothetical protein